MRTLGIAGTAKNTGKTTALNALLAEARAGGVPVGVTSIGYDGEAVDNVTGLPKPRVLVHPGTLVTTARSCLGGDALDPRWEVLESTGFATALGEVLIVRCRTAGTVVLAGPNKRYELARVLERMGELGPALTLVDGALNRLAPMSVASGLILATGAARTPDLDALARETAAMEALLALPAVPEADRSAGAPPGEAVVQIPFPAIDDVLSVVADARHAEGPRGTLHFSGPLAPAVLQALPLQARLRGRVEGIVFVDPVMLLLSGDPRAMAEAVASCRRLGVPVSVGRSLPLAAVTVSPFHARYEGHGYVADAVPADLLRESLTVAVRAPVVDVVRDGGGALWRVVEGLAGPGQGRPSGREG